MSDGSRNAFIGRTQPPSDADLTAALGAARLAWDLVVVEMARELGIAVREWKTYGVKHGWALRLQQGRRNTFGWGRRQATHIWMADAFASVRLHAPSAAAHGQQLVLVGRVERCRRFGSEAREGGGERDRHRRADLRRHRPPVRQPSPGDPEVLAGSQDVAIGFRLGADRDIDENAPEERCFALQTLELCPAS